jgi:vancomycin permeability regulator SanA
MAEKAPRPRLRWLARLVRRVLLPGALLGALAIGSANAFLLHTTAGDIAPDVASAPTRPVAIVLGTTASLSGALSPGLAARTRVALDLYKVGKVRKIFLSGAYSAVTGYDEPGSMAGWLERRGVPHEALVLDRDGHRTAATMANAAAQGYRDALVCTQAFHLPRSLYLARHAGITATGVPGADRWYSFEGLRAHMREWLARTEILVEVALRGVKAH